MRESLEVDVNPCTPAERTFLFWAAAELFGADWRDIPAQATFRVYHYTDAPADWVSVLVYAKPRRIDRDGDVATGLRQVDVTDANRTAVCVLRAIAERQSRWNSRPRW